MCFVLSIPVARGANWFLAGGGRRMDEEEATAAAAERIAAAAEDGTSLPVRLATDVVRFLYGGTGRREPADGGVVSASLLNAKPAIGGIGVEPRGGGVLRVLFTVASDAVADTVVRWRHKLRRCVDSTAVFDVLSDREEAQHQALWPAFLAAKVAGKRAQLHRARLVVDGERGSGVEAPGRARARAARPLSSGTSALYQVDMECDEAHATAVKGALHARMAPLEVDCGRMRAAPAMLLDSGGPVDDAHYLVRFTPTDTLPWTPAHVHSWLGANGVRADWVVQYQCGAGGPVPVQWRGAARGQGPAPSLAWLSAREPGFVASVHGGHAFVSKAIRAPHVECRQRTDAPSFCRLRVSRLPLSMLGPARPARAAGAAGAPGGPPPGGPPPGGTPPDARAAGAPGAPGGPPPGGLPPRPPLGGQAPSYAAAVQGLHAGPGVQHQLGTIEEGADDEDHDSYGHGAGDGDDDEDGAGPGGGGSAEAAIAAAAAAAAAAAGPSDERAANLVLREHALAAERQKRVQVDQLLAERRAFEDRQKATAAAAAVGAAAAAVGKEALQADRDREERMLDATQSAGRKRAGGDEELDAADDAPLGTPVGLRQPEPRRGEAAPEAAEDGEEGRRMARRRTGGDEGGVAMPAAAPAAAGPDGIPVDVWRKLGEPAFVLLAAVFTAVGATGETPPGFLDGVVASIYKAKDAAVAANYRPLTMLGSDYRILAKVLATRWPLLAAVVGPEQTAFLAGRRISDNICLTQMLPGLLAANAAEGVGPTGAALALLDFRKAYDTIDRGCLLAVMEAVGVGDGVLAWTRTILTHTYASAEVNGFISEPRRYAAGVRQGCPAAPALFLFLGHALACFLRTCPAVGVEVVPGCRVTCPQYADDCMPLLRSCAPAAVAALVEAMAVFGRATGLVLNLGKCGILPLGSAGEGLLAGAEVAGLRVLDAGVSLGVPVSAGLPPPEAVTGVCAGLRTLEAAVPGLWRLPLLSACKEPIWRLWWRIENASKLTSEPVWSDSFEAGIGTWRLRVHLGGHGKGKGTHLSVYRHAEDAMWEPTADYRLTLINHADAKKSITKGTITRKFSVDDPCWGYDEVIELAELRGKTNGWLVDDTLTLRVDVTVKHEDRFQLKTGGMPCDVALKLACGVEMPVVSQILQLASPFFLGALEDVKGSVLIPVDGSLSAWTYILSDLYPLLDPPPLTMGGVFVLLPVVHKYDFTRLVKRLVAFVKENSETLYPDPVFPSNYVIRWLALAEQLQLDTLRDVCLNRLRVLHREDIEQAILVPGGGVNDEVKHLGHDMLVELLAISARKIAL
ncbi:hypothetical protein FOA52_013378 [Chlamydomonas sp. UWO 241]|nr:hypothetical protein FOA52_013378 [Chlamydomonas sp. UWO 241]